MKKHETLQELRKRKEEILTDANRLRQRLLVEVDEKKIAKAREVEERFGELRARIDELEDERHEVLVTPRTREEMLFFAKEQLAKGKQQALRKLLGEHLAVCHRQRGEPFNPAEVRVNLLTDGNLWLAYFLLITDEDLEAACADLPEIGKPQAEIEARVKQINDEIASLVDQISAL